MDYYVAVNSLGFGQTIWEVDKPNARNMMQPSTLTSTLTEGPGEDVVTLVADDMSPHVIHKLNITPGQYYPRIARPSYPRLDFPSSITPLSDEKVYRADALRQLHFILSTLDDLFLTVEPTEANFSTYGHAFRNLLLIACTEVEMHLKGIMTANNYTPSGSRFTMNDYCKVGPAMRLSEFELKFVQYHTIPNRQPFAAWASASAPLPWYKAYNAVKHNREVAFDQAKMEHVIDAVSAVIVLLAGQFGAHLGQDVDFEERPWKPVKFTSLPQWQPSDWYHSDFSGTGTRRPKNFAF
ncbi:hypothetical protein [Asticcacaulis excentricus]|uniref:Uncharacterized protein n=1 Tax=Asticcacaulis excentricus (strain ATCC 15261 / DSM 4724 / KCTC 12464 / NCIMB 9791 / VKM B-1370 / CB 48) TaxID=573065 RepID=E8RPW2_ASTEC|nr:hypothetical protein [Asticcacaulis excentricus]ADU13135.1 hypothetical protein Astex_1469 [Asticcacaulis excentricus CB 48]